jgi:hypothetical protein
MLFYFIHKYFEGGSLGKASGLLEAAKSCTLKAKNRVPRALRDRINFSIVKFSKSHLPTA